jgi:serine/threonine-protein kinase
VLALSCLLALCGAPGLSRDAHAQPRADTHPGSASDRAAAQVLFDEGRALMEKRRFEAACAKFAESFGLDPGIGTQLNLAACYERVGRTASAWINFVEAAASARKAGQAQRVEVATQRAAALEPGLVRLTIVVAKPATGMAIRRNADVVGQAQWGTAVPVDPGKHSIRVEAPGKRPWRKTVTVDASNPGVELEVPVLADAPPPPPPEVAEPTPTGSDASQMVAGIALSGLGVGAVALGAGFGVAALGDNDESLRYCLPADDNQCSPEGVALRDDAITSATISTVAFAAGGAMLLTGIILWATAPSADAEPDSERRARSTPTVTLSPDGGTLGWALRW